MPKGKKIYEDLSKKYAERRRNKENRVKDKTKNREGPLGSTIVSNFEVNKPTIARSLNFPKVAARRRQISNTEGKPVVNASMDIEKLIHKSRSIAKSPLNSPTAGVIRGEEAPRRRGRPSKSGNTPRKKNKNAKT